MMSVLSVGIILFSLLVFSSNATKPCARQDEVRCMMDPCRFAECPLVPQAKCESNYCGGCNADFYLNGVQLFSSDCHSSPKTKGELPTFGTEPKPGNAFGRFDKSFDLTDKSNIEAGPRRFIDLDRARQRNRYSNRLFESRGRSWGGRPSREGSRNQQNGGRHYPRPHVPPFQGGMPVEGNRRSSPRFPTNQQRRSQRNRPSQRSNSSRSRGGRRRSWHGSFFRNMFRS